MSVTLETARNLQQVFALDAQVAGVLVDLMRAYGVRRENARCVACLPHRTLVPLLSADRVCVEQQKHWRAPVCVQPGAGEAAAQRVPPPSEQHWRVVHLVGRAPPVSF